MPTTFIQPTEGDVHVSTPLTNFSQKYLLRDEMFVAMRAIPNLPVAKQFDLYYIFDRGDFYRDEMQERADGTESQGGSFTLSTDPYFARTYAFHKDVSDRQRANQDSVINLDNSATQFVTHKALIRRESVFQTNIFAANIWFNGGTSASAGEAVNWGTGGSDPIENIRTAIRTVHGITGYRPNRMVLGRQAYDTLQDNDEILSRITGGSTNAQPANVTRALMAALFELEEIFVMDAVRNTANQGADDAISFIGGDDALVYYSAAAASQEEPTAAMQFSWTGMLGNTENGIRIKRFRMEPREADRVEAQMSFDMKVIAPEMGYFFTGVSS